MRKGNFYEQEVKGVGLELLEQYMETGDRNYLVYLDELAACKEFVDEVGVTQ